MGNQKPIQDQQQIEEILSNAKFIRLALAEDNTPYIVPMSFGYKDNAIYLHSSPKGKKIEILKKNNKVYFELDTDAEIVPADDPCKYNVHYRSVIGSGRAEILENYDKKIEGLAVLSEHYGKEGPFKFEEKKVRNLCVIKVKIEKMTGKEAGF